MTDKKDEIISALEARVAALEEKGKPPEEPKPFVPGPYQRYDPTANMRMPESTLREMCNAVPDHVMRGVMRDARAPTGRPGMIPEQPSNVRPDSGAANTSGWRDATPIGPPPGVAQADKLMDHQDKLDRAELAQRLGALKR
jgi:hypothetical protein